METIGAGSDNHTGGKGQEVKVPETRGELALGSEKQDNTSDINLTIKSLTEEMTLQGPI